VNNGRLVAAFRQAGQDAALVVAVIGDVQPILEQATFAQRGQPVELLVDRVIVTDDELEIRYIILTQPEKPHTPFLHLRTNY
jgi:hypothetical protein